MRTFGWLLVVANLIGAAALYFGRNGGDAATRGLGRGIGGLLAVLAIVAAVLLWWGGRASGRGIAFIIAGAIVAVPLVVLMLFMSESGLALLFPSRRGIPKPGPVVRYDFPDAATKEVALAIVMGDHDRVDSLIQTTKPDLAARDERGQSLLGIATHHAMVYGATMDYLGPLRQLLVAGAVPRPDDAGPEELMITKLARVTGEPAAAAFAMLLEAGLSPDERDSDGRSVLFDNYLTPEAARVLLAHGVTRTPRDTGSARQEWSPLAHQAERENWATAHVLLEAGVPLDYATPPGSRFAQVMASAQEIATEADSADVGFRALVAAAAAAPPPARR
ncbi:MAG: hypothetical protein IPK85_22330 [Gemmatimonadetes bacterium]|nr:hypothetical protein [Gemmatimonadota bacterium]